jgi:hypothetical protein
VCFLTLLDTLNSSPCFFFLPLMLPSRFFLRTCSTKYVLPRLISKRQNPNAFFFDVCLRKQTSSPNLPLSSSLPSSPISLPSRLPQTLLKSPLPACMLFLKHFPSKRLGSPHIDWSNTNSDVRHISGKVPEYYSKTMTEQKQQSISADAITSNKELLPLLLEPKPEQTLTSTAATTMRYSRNLPCFFSSGGFCHPQLKKWLKVYMQTGAFIGLALTLALQSTSWIFVSVIFWPILILIPVIICVYGMCLMLDEKIFPDPYN